VAPSGKHGEHYRRDLVLGVRNGARSIDRAALLVVEEELFLVKKAPGVSGALRLLMMYLLE
jgi:hypothetical protein